MADWPAGDWLYGATTLRPYFGLLAGRTSCAHNVDVLVSTPPCPAAAVGGAAPYPYSAPRSLLLLSSSRHIS